MSTNTMNTGSQVTDGRVKAMVVTAFFAAITFLGIQSFRIPLPAAIGTPFVHFGHIFVVMGIWVCDYLCGNLRMHEYCD